MRAFLRCVAFVVTIAAVVVSEPNDLSKQVTILKCCRHGEELQRSDGDLNDELPHCEPTLNEWKPLIYSPMRQIFFQKVPSEWHVLDGRRPECDDRSELIHVPYRKANPFVLLDNGNVVLETGNRDTLPVSHYCADSNALFVCMQRKTTGNHAAATMRPRVRRCCGENATFHEHKNTCVHLKETADAPLLLPNASSVVEIVAGFPTCPKSDNFTILGDARDAVLQPDGGLEINGIALPTGQFCVERIKELNQIAKVFACPEHAPQKPAVRATDIRFTLYPVGFIISAVFLAATLAAGWLLPASHHVLHWRCQTHHVACLMMGDILMAIIQLAGDSLHGASCKALAIDLREKKTRCRLYAPMSAGITEYTDGIRIRPTIGAGFIWPAQTARRCVRARMHRFDGLRSTGKYRTKRGMHRNAILKHAEFRRQVHARSVRSDAKMR
ncbi:hypothetical protein ACFW04_000422 [Cataglyphis niger]